MVSKLLDPRVTGELSANVALTKVKAAFSAAVAEHWEGEEA